MLLRRFRYDRSVVPLRTIDERTTELYLWEVGVAHYQPAFMRACEWSNLLTCQNLMVVRNQMRESAVAPKGDSEGLENPHWLTSGRPSTTEATRIG